MIPGNLVAVLILMLAPSAPCGLSGRVVDAEGSPVAGARVFVEPGLAGQLVETTSNADGAWHFDNPMPSGTGVFAIAEGFAFGGVHKKIALGDSVADAVLRLALPASISGVVTDDRGRPVKGTRITRVALLGMTKVGIPLTKLTAFGFDEPVSDAEGHFTVSNLPEGGVVALKAAHPDYAQEAVGDVPVGQAEVRVRLERGVLLEGEVLLREDRAPVARAAVIVRNTQPPYDTAVTQTGRVGAFAIRLKPGLYVYQAASAVMHSPGWERLDVPEQGRLPRLRLYVARIGQIRGKVCDAVSGDPIAGAAIGLSADGNIAAVTRTDATGEFALHAVAGENVVRLEAIPGYALPEQPALRVPVTAGEEVVLPTFWAAPIPTYEVLIVDADDKPAPGVIVSVLRPEQFGWQITDAEGKAHLRFAAKPQGDAIIASAEHPREPLGALFAIEPKDRAEAKVQLLPLGSVSGRVVTSENQPVEGAVVAGLLGEVGLVLWQAVSDAQGVFEWDSVVPLAPQQCAVCVDGTPVGESVPFLLDAAGSKGLGDLVLPEGKGQEGMRGKTVAWYRLPLVAGTLPDRKERKDSAAVVFYCKPADAPMVIETLTAAQSVFPDERIVFAMVVDGSYACENSAIPVLSGQAPGPATTYLVDPEGKVILETFGMPPLQGLQRLAALTPQASAEVR